MVNALLKYRKLMADVGVDCLLVNSTNEFLVEYNELAENSCYKLTGFTGSTGDALVTNDKVYLFVDGRYHLQADNEVDHDMVTVVKLQSGQSLQEEILKRVPENSVMGSFAKKNCQARIEEFEEVRKGILIADDPLDTPVFRSPVNYVQLDKNLTGFSTDEKIDLITEDMNDDENIYVTNLEEVSYLFNMRDFSTPYSSKINMKAYINKKGADFVTSEEDLQALEGKFFVDKSSINAYDFYMLGERAIPIEDSPVKLLKSVKTDAEIEHYISAFERTDKTMYAIRDFIENNENLSEFDIAEKLKKYFFEFGAKNLSFKSIVAKDKNSASAHYSKSSKDEILTDGSLVLIDCGAYYEGGLATDITRVFAKGSPNDLQKKVYTTVLKTFLNAYHSRSHNGYEIDAAARNIISQNPVDGFVFNHGLGHGIGINVHECPPNLSNSEIAKTSIKDNMCFTIEPGLYNPQQFGIRLENSCYYKNGRINSFSKMCYEKKLIDYTLLSGQEKEWLSEFEVR